MHWHYVILFALNKEKIKRNANKKATRKKIPITKERKKELLNYIEENNKNKMVCKNNFLLLRSLTCLTIRP